MPPEKGRASDLTTEEVKEIVRQTVHETLTSMGINVTDPEQLIEAQSDFAYVRKARLGSEEVAKWVKRGLVGAGVSAFLYMLTHGFADGVKMLLSGGVK